MILSFILHFAMTGLINVIILEISNSKDKVSSYSDLIKRFLTGFFIVPLFGIFVITFIGLVLFNIKYAIYVLNKLEEENDKLNHDE